MNTDWRTSNLQQWEHKTSGRRTFKTLTT